jgi:hypothetical protein
VNKAKPAACASAVLIAALLATACGPSPRAPEATTLRARTPLVKTFGEFLTAAEVGSTSRQQWTAIARRDTVVVLNSWDYRLVTILKHANPKVQVWVYKDLSGIRSDDCATATGACGSCPRGIVDSKFLSSGLGFCWVKRHHPDWFLRAVSSGQPFEFKGYPATWEADYGNRTYQRQWVRNVLSDVRQHGWDGVKVDNALTTDAYGQAMKYPTDAAVQRATYSALREVGPALHRARVASVFNVGYALQFPRLWTRWLAAVDGLQQEYYLSFSTQPSAVGAAWAAYEHEISACVADRKSCWFHSGSYSSKVSSRTRYYALTSFLLDTDGRQLLAVGSPRSIPATECSGPGSPVSSAAREPSGLWLRSFKRGVVAVNATSSRTWISLGGRHFDSGPRIALQSASGTVIGGTDLRGCP